MIVANWSASLLILNLNIAITVNLFHTIGRELVQKCRHYVHTNSTFFLWNTSKIFYAVQMRTLVQFLSYCSFSPVFKNGDNLFSERYDWVFSQFVALILTWIWVKAYHQAGIVAATSSGSAWWQSVSQLGTCPCGDMWILWWYSSRPCRRLHCTEFSCSWLVCSSLGSKDIENRLLYLHYRSDNRFTQRSLMLDCLKDWSQREFSDGVQNSKISTLICIIAL